MVKPNNKTKGILFILMAAFGFSLMTMFVKLSGDLPPFEKAFFRNFVAAVFIAIMMIKKKISFIPKKENLPDLFGRAAFGTAGLICNFYAIGQLALPDSNMLNKLSPFFAIMFSAVLLKEKPNIVQIIGIFTALTGSVFIIKPGFDNPSVFPAIIGLLGGMGAGIAYTFVRKLGLKGENGMRIIFFFSAFSCVVCLPMLIIGFKPMTLIQLVYLLMAGVCACIGQVGITKAYLLAPAKEISVYDYAQVIFSAILGYIVFDELADKWSFLGYFLICSAGVAMYLYNNRKSKIKAL